MESEAIKFDEYLANNLEKRFEFLYENYSIMKILIKDYKEEDKVISEMPFYGSSFCSQKKHGIMKFASQIGTNFQYRRCGGGA